MSAIGPENHFAYVALEQAFQFRATGEVLPTWFVTAGDGTHHVIGTPFTDDYSSKREISKMLADWIREFDATEIIFVSDVWTRVEMGPVVERPTKRVSEHLDAREAICVQVWRKDRKGFAIMRMYRQNDDGSLEILEQQVSDGEGETETFAEAISALRS